MMENDDIDNVVRIGSYSKLRGGKKIHEYVWPVLRRMQPDCYEKYGCIKLEFTKNMIPFVQSLIQWFWHAGLVLKEVSKVEEAVRDIENLWDAKMVKIGAIVFEDNEKFEEFTRKEFEKIK